MSGEKQELQSSPPYAIHANTTGKENTAPNKARGKARDRKGTHAGTLRTRRAKAEAPLAGERQQTGLPTHVRAHHAARTRNKNTRQEGT